VIGGDNVVVDHIEFSLCAVPDLNGAGIRGEGHNLTVVHCFFHENENGILIGEIHPCSVRIEHSEFDRNGHGDGYSHNLYIGKVDSLFFHFNYTHRASVGHELKSRAYYNDIRYNKIQDEAQGTASYSIDLPNGGTSFVIGNVIEQGPVSENGTMISYLLEGNPNPSPAEIFVYNNTFINHRSSGNVFNVNPISFDFLASNNIFAGPGNFAAVGSFTPVDSSTNVIHQTIGAVGFVSDVNYDYHLTAAATDCINHGTPFGALLTAVYEFADDLLMTSRCHAGIIDIGAFEYCTPTGIQTEYSFAPNFYPNPVKDVLHLQNVTSNAPVRIWNSVGQCMFSGVVSGPIDTSHWQSGLYFLLIDGVGEMKVVKE
jgi:Secretion system C-terminal sorting domain